VPHRLAGASGSRGGMRPMGSRNLGKTGEQYHPDASAVSIITL
jgi:hypothetical protein